LPRANHVQSQRRGNRVNDPDHVRSPDSVKCRDTGNHDPATGLNRDRPTARAGQTAAGIDDHGLPDILYQYVTIGVGGRIPYYSTEKLYFGLLVNFNFHAMLSFGELGTGFADTSTTTSLYGNGGYGQASGYGFRVGFTPLELIPWKGITVRLSGFYEMFTTAFTLGSNINNNVSLPPVDRTLENAARHIAQGAVDQYFGGVVQIGYQY